jgi:hypothetical protein
LSCRVLWMGKARLGVRRDNCTRGSARSGHRGRQGGRSDGAGMVHGRGGYGQRVRQAPSRGEGQDRGRDRMEKDRKLTRGCRPTTGYPPGRQAPRRQRHTGETPRVSGRTHARRTGGRSDRERTGRTTRRQPHGPASQTGEEPTPVPIYISSPCPTPPRIGPNTPPLLAFRPRGDPPGECIHGGVGASRHYSAANPATPLNQAVSPASPALIRGGVTGIHGGVNGIYGDRPTCRSNTPGKRNPTVRRLRVL